MDKGSDNPKNIGVFNIRKEVEMELNKIYLAIPLTPKRDEVFLSKSKERYYISQVFDLIDPSPSFQDYCCWWLGKAAIAFWAFIQDTV